MKLLISINFDNNINNYFAGMQTAIKKYVFDAEWTEPTNFHLTLNYLGECDDIQASSILETLNSIDFERFTLEIDRFDEFRTKNDGHIIWAGVKENEVLLALQQNLQKKLTSIGFNFEYKFIPHITLCTNALSPHLLTPLVKPITFEVNKIDLIRTDKIDGKRMSTLLASKSATTAHLSLN